MPIPSGSSSRRHCQSCRLTKIPPKNFSRVQLRSSSPLARSSLCSNGCHWMCPTRLLTLDHYCEELDYSSNGIHSTLSSLFGLLKANDEELWWHLEFESKV